MPVSLPPGKRASFRFVVTPVIPRLVQNPVSVRLTYRHESQLR